MSEDRCKVVQMFVEGEPAECHHAVGNMGALIPVNFLPIDQSHMVIMIAPAIQSLFWEFSCVSS